MSGRPRSAPRAAPACPRRRSTCCAPRATPPRWAPTSATSSTYTRQLIRTNRVEQAVHDRLKERHGVQWLVELTAAANYFAFLSGMVNAFEVPAPPDGDKLPS